MNCFCEDCHVGARSYEDWIVHLTTAKHQDISSSPKIEKWVIEQNPTCIIMASLFEKKNLIEVASKFSKYGFLYNFYAHHDQKFFIMQYDTRQTADFAFTKAICESSWRLHVKRLKDLDQADWAALFPQDEDPEPEQEVEEPPAKLPRQDTVKTQCDGFTAKSNDSGFVSNTGVPVKVAEPHRIPQSPSTTTAVKPKPLEDPRRNFDKGSEYYDPFELVDSPAVNPPKPSPVTPVQSNKNAKQQQQNPNLISIIGSKLPSYPRHNITSFARDLMAMEVVAVPSPMPMPPMNQPKQDQQVNGKPKAEEKLAPKQAMESLMAEKKDSSIDEQLDQFFKCTAISIKELERINNTVIPELVGTLKERFPQVELFLFDSFQGGVGNPVCSLEINMLGIDLNNNTRVHTSTKEKEKKCEMAIAEISRMLSTADPKNSQIRGVRAKMVGLSSRVHFIHKISARHDFVLTACGGRDKVSRKNNLKLTRFYTKLDPSVRPLLCFVFYWANFHQFLSTEFQQIRDYILALLVIMFLSKKKIVPTIEEIQVFCQGVLNVSEENWLGTLCNSEQLSQTAIQLIQKEFVPAHIFILDLAKEFFETYGKEALNHEVICTWTADFLPRSAFTDNMEQLPPQLKWYKRCLEKRRGDLFCTNSALAIQNPFDLAYNPGMTVKLHVFIKFQVACNVTAKMIQELLNNESEGKSCSLMNVFTPMTPPQSREAIPSGDAEGAEPESADTEPAHLASVRIQCELLLKRINVKAKGQLHLMCPVPEIRDECKRFCFFDIERAFRDKFKKRMKMLTYYKQTDEDFQLRNGHLCCLWSTYALDFIRNIWKQCFFIDSSERVWYSEKIALGPQQQRTFPQGYEIYLSKLECKGFTLLQPGFRWKQLDTTTQTQPPNPAVPIRENPFLEEWNITNMSVSEAQARKKTGNPAWTFNCMVGYEDQNGRHDQPRIAFVVSGKDADSKSLDYLLASIKRMFGNYQLRRLEEWLSKL